QRRECAAQRAPLGDPDHALSEALELPRAGLRPRPRGGAHRALGRQGARPGAREEGLRLDPRRAQDGKMSTMRTERNDTWRRAYEALAPAPHAWLRELRQAGWAQFSEQGFPTTRLE